MTRRIKNVSDLVAKVTLSCCQGKLNYEHAVQLLRKAFTIIDVLLIHFLRVYLLLECKDTFNLFRILQAIYIFLSNITIVIEHDDNFDKSSLKFLASIR